MTPENKNPDSSALDKLVADLQAEIDETERAAYSPRIVELCHDPPNWGALEGDGIISSAYFGPCGDTMTFYLDIKDGIIKRASFTTSGCGASVAAGAQATLLLIGRPVAEAMVLEPRVIDAALGGLPPDHVHCAELAVRTLRKVLTGRVSV